MLTVKSQTRPCHLIMKAILHDCQNNQTTAVDKLLMVMIKLYFRMPIQIIGNVLFFFSRKKHNKMYKVIFFCMNFLDSFTHELRKSLTVFMKIILLYIKKTD